MTTTRKIGNRRWAGWVCLMLITATGGLAACGDDGEDDEEAVESVLVGLVEDFNASDAPGFIAAFTDEALAAFFEMPGATREELLAVATEAVGTSWSARNDRT